MNVGRIKFKIRDINWFGDKGKIGEYVIGAKNIPEIKTRMKWLGEGSLEHHMTKFKSPIQHGGNQEEKNLYTAFMEFLANKNTHNNMEESIKLSKDITNLGMIYEMVNKSDRISNKDRHRITNVVTKHGLDGNGRFVTVGEAISALSSALDSMGYSLDMISDHVIAQAHHDPGSKGSRLFPYRRKNLSGDPYEEEPQIENSRISFNWEDLGRDVGFEVVAYAS